MWLLQYLSPGRVTRTSVVSCRIPYTCRSSCLSVPLHPQSATTTLGTSACPEVWLLQYLSHLWCLESMYMLSSRPRHYSRFHLRSNCPCCVRNCILCMTAHTSELCLDLCVKDQHFYSMGGPTQFRTQHRKFERN